MLEPVNNAGSHHGPDRSVRCGPCQIYPCGSTGCLWPDLAAPADDLVQQIDLGPDRLVLEYGSPAGHVWILRAGLLRVQRHGADGRRQILSLALPGEIVGFDLQPREGLTVETATACTLCRIDRPAFDHRMAERPDLRHAIYLQQIDQLDRLRWLIWAIGALAPEERLCAFLALATRFMPFLSLPDGSGMLSMRISRPDLADLLAISVETIDRITQRLCLAGVLSMRDPVHFRIASMTRLKSLGRIDRMFATLPFGRMLACSRPVPAAVAPDAADLYPRLVRSRFADQ